MHDNSDARQNGCGSSTHAPAGSSDLLGYASLRCGRPHRRNLEPAGQPRDHAAAGAHSDAAEVTGGEGEIRTREGLATLPVFKTGAFNRSATSPARAALSQLLEMTANTPMWSLTPLR